MWMPGRATSGTSLGGISRLPLDHFISDAGSSGDIERLACVPDVICPNFWAGQVLDKGVNKRKLLSFSAQLQAATAASEPSHFIWGEGFLSYSQSHKIRVSCSP